MRASKILEVHQYNNYTDYYRVPGRKKKESDLV